MTPETLRHWPRAPGTHAAPAHRPPRSTAVRTPAPSRFGHLVVERHDHRLGSRAQHLQRMHAIVRLSDDIPLRAPASPAAIVVWFHCHPQPTHASYEILAFHPSSLPALQTGEWARGALLLKRTIAKCYHNVYRHRGSRCAQIARISILASSRRLRGPLVRSLPLPPPADDNVRRPVSREKERYSNVRAWERIRERSVLSPRRRPRHPGAPGRE